MIIPVRFSLSVQDSPQVKRKGRTVRGASIRNHERLVSNKPLQRLLNGDIPLWPNPGVAYAPGRVKPLRGSYAALRLKALVWPKGSLPARGRPETTTPLFPRKQLSPSDRPAAVQGAKRRSETLTARTDLESSKAREKGILAHHGILGELRGERSEAAKREAPPLRMSVRGRKPT